MLALNSVIIFIKIIWTLFYQLNMFKMISKSMFSVSVDIIFHTVATFFPPFVLEPSWNFPIKQPCPCLTLQIILRLLSGGVA